MDRKLSYSLEKPEIVVVAADVAINAHLQKLLNKGKYSNRGFFDVEAAINWSKLQHNHLLYVLISPPEHLTLHEAILTLCEANSVASCIVLVDSEEYKSTEAVFSDSDFIEVLPKGEIIYEVLHLFIQQIIRRIAAERELNEILNTSKTISVPPQTKETAVVEEPETPYIAPETFFTAPERKLKILLAEDDTINQMYLAGFLRSQGWDVDTAYNGLDAMALYAAGKYDLVVLDGQMPKMDGFETAQKIRSTETEKESVPILAISGYANPEDKERFFEAGMDEYISKPVDENELLQVIYKLTQ